MGVDRDHLKRLAPKIDAAIELVKQGAVIADAARAAGISHNTLTGALRRAGIDARDYGDPKIKSAKTGGGARASELIDQGLSLTEAARRAGISPVAALNYRRRHGKDRP